MQKTKILIATVAAVALTLVLVGLASAQIAANQTYTATTSNTAAPNGGFLGWIGNCFGYTNNQPYTGQYAATQTPPDNAVPAPYQPYQGGYYSNGYGYGYGPCWTR